VLGRAAYGEKVVDGDIRDSWYIRKDDRLIWADSFRISGESFSQLHRKALLSNYRAIAMLIYYGPSLGTLLEVLRETLTALQCQCAATHVGGVIVVRFAAEASSDLRLALRNFLHELNRERGPGPFRVPKMWEC
jgi:urease accessory protein